MFWIAFVIFIVTTIIYSMWASGEVQPWNDPVKRGALENGQAKGNVASAQIYASAPNDLSITSKTDKQ